MYKIGLLKWQITAAYVYSKAKVCQKCISDGPGQHRIKVKAKENAQQQNRNMSKVHAKSAEKKKTSQNENTR